MLQYFSFGLRLSSALVSERYLGFVLTAVLAGFVGCCCGCWWNRNQPPPITTRISSGRPNLMIFFKINRLLSCGNEYLDSWPVLFAVYRLGSKMLERHGTFWSQKAVFKTDLGLSPGRSPALRPISWLSILEPNLSAKYTFYWSITNLDCS